MRGNRFIRISLMRDDGARLALDRPAILASIVCGVEFDVKRLQQDARVSDARWPHRPHCWRRTALLLSRRWRWSNVQDGFQEAGELHGENEFRGGAGAKIFQRFEILQAHRVRIEGSRDLENFVECQRVALRAE